MPEGLQWVLDAYWDLDTDRNPNGNIRWTVARKWFEVSGQRETVWRLFWDTLREIDAAYAEHFKNGTGA